MSRKSKKRAAKRAAEAVPEEILAEGSGPNADPIIEADAQALADAAADALASAEIAEVEAEVEAVAMAAEVVVTAAEAARAAKAEADASHEAPEAPVEAQAPAQAAAKASKGKKKRGRKAEPAVELDAWGQPILVEDESLAADAAAAHSEAAAEASEGGADPLQAAGDAPEDADDALDDGNDGDAGDADELAADGDTPSEEAATDEMRADAADASETGDMAGDELAGDGDEAVEGAEAAEGAVLPTSAATMDATQLRHLVEALVFAADKPVTVQRLRQLTRVSDTRRIEQALAELAEEFKGRGIALQVVSGGYQFRTNTHYSSYVQQLIAGRPVRLSRAQLETLAIVAYRQPITRPEIDEIRGVDSSSTLKVLLERSLIRILGKREEAGRPTLYGTTKEFLDFFSLGDLRELPTLREYSELTAESRKVVSDRLGVSLDGEAAADAPPADAGASPLGDEGDAAPLESSEVEAAAEHGEHAEAVEPGEHVDAAEPGEHVDAVEPGEHVDAAEHGEHVETAVDMHAAHEADAPPAGEPATGAEVHAELRATEADPASTGDDAPSEPTLAFADLGEAADDESDVLGEDDEDLAPLDDEAQRAADDAAALAAVQAVDSHATMAREAPLDLDDIAARVTAGESDRHGEAPSDELAPEGDVGGGDAADAALHAHDADSEAPDASASDDPAVD